MTIITNEMRVNAGAFIIRWRGITTERAEAQTFTNEFFQIFGLDRKKLAQFEKPIQKKDELGKGFADLFWSGKLIIESKSAHLDNPKHWEKTLVQAEEYIDNLLPHQKPQFIMLMNFKRIRKYEVIVLSSKKVEIKFLCEVPLENLAAKLDEFNFFIEFANRLESDEEKVNQEAARRIANVYDAIERKGYESNDIAILLARILFCMFAEDTGIFERKQFENYIINHTNGENLGDRLLQLFATLNTPKLSRQTLTTDETGNITNMSRQLLTTDGTGTLNKDLDNFPYVNGDLFNANLIKVPQTTNALRKALLECCNYDWSDISPVIFGALFQAVIHNSDRRSLGAHYTSEKNILRVIRPLFLDKLQEEFESIKSSKTALNNFRKKLNTLTFLDPACGCGNFLVVTYRELRLLDIEVIRKINIDDNQTIIDSGMLSNVPLSNFYGYEIEPTSAMIAEVAMWLTQHQMNMRLESDFGKAVPTIPLKEAANIENVNSLHKNWEGKTKFVSGQGEVNVIFDYILGNPPFIGSKLMTQSNRDDVVREFDNISGAGVLDYVTAWYSKAAKYIQGTKIKAAFVSTNSIVQGEQTSILWGQLLNKYNIKIHFAHRTFKWSNEATNNAAVYCVIIGFANFDTNNKIIFDYDDIKGEPNEIKVSNINPYLVDSKDIIINKRSEPICKVPKMSFGNMPLDGGNLLLSDEEKREFILKEPKAEKYIKPLISAHEFLNGKKRWCLWLVGVDPNALRQLPEVMNRVKLVRKFRLDSIAPSTQKFASTPTMFRDRNQPDSFIVVPRVSSENRKYIPMGFFDKNSIVSDTCMSIPNGNLYHFGVLMSIMHMAWVKYVCGRLKSDFRYSKDIVYNNYPWAPNPTEKQIKAVEEAAQNVLDIRAQFPDSSLADLYDQLTMPPVLLKAHSELDKAVDKCYREAPFTTEPKRIEYLFELYDTYTSGMFPEKKKGKKSK
jgi:hypothetical protein